MASNERKRMALGPKGKRLSFELRLRQKLWGMGVPALVLAGYLLWDEGWFAVLVGVCCVAMGWALVVSLVMESVVKPMQTLSNVIAGLREDDFSFRARGGRRNDAVGDLAIEVNALAAMLQMQRGSALEAVALAERVMSAMQTPVLAFDGVGRVQMMNPAAERVFGLELGAVMGVPGAAVGLDGLLVQKEEEPVSLGGAEAGSRWVVKRTGFRMQGIPHVLVVLSEVSSALREEERNAWRRLVRVMGHEINNSLTPIKSIAGSLRGRLPESVEGTPNLNRDLQRGLAIIEDRAASLILPRTLAAIQQRIDTGIRASDRLSAGLRPLEEAGANFRLDYLAIVDPETLLPVPEATPGTLIAIAAWVGETRLIDNLIAP